MGVDEPRQLPGLSILRQRCTNASHSHRHSLTKTDMVRESDRARMYWDKLSVVDSDHQQWMLLAIEEGELARGTTGDNPWVGCVIVSAEGALVGRGHTLGPGEDHAEIAAARDAEAHGYSVAGATLYSTLEPCSFHGRTPACSRSIAARGITRVVIGIRDPHPRVDGAGIAILRAAGVEVLEGFCEAEIRRQLGPWIIEHHPHEPRQRAEALSESARLDQGRLDPRQFDRLADIYGVDRARIQALFEPT